MARYIISASPLVKVYLTEWHERLKENPELIFDATTPFSFSIPSGIQAFRVDFNKPMLVKKPKPGSYEQANKGKSAELIELPGASVVSEGKEIETLYNWLTGEAGLSYHETDIFGCVPFDPGFDVVERVDQMAAYEALLSGDPKEALKAKKELDKIQQDTAKRVAEARHKVKAASEARIKRAMRTVHNNLIKQWQHNQEMKLGKYPPSISEALGKIALSAELKEKASRNKLQGDVEAMMTGV